MRKMTTLALVGGTLCGAVGSVAAQARPSSTAFVAAVYYRCPQATEDRVDSLMKSTIGPIFERHRTAGAISSWGWLAHSWGTDWRRAGYFVAPTRDSLLDARAAIIRDIQAAAARNPAQSLAAICPSHDDYIWALVASAEGGPAPGANRQPFSLSHYHQCDMAREARADEIFQTVLAPIYNKHMRAGHLASWAWFRHDMGGPARRLSTLDAADAKAALNALDMVLGEAAATAPRATQEFLSICGSHTDYVWRVVMAKP